MIYIVNTGYYHPSNANWSYQIYLIIDKTGARFYKSTFGGDSRMIRDLSDKGFEIKKLNTGIGDNACYKWSEVKEMPDIETYTGKNY